MFKKNDIFSLENKTVVITGGAGSLCSSIAMGLGKAGAKIAICDKSDSREIISRLKNNGIECRGYYIDVTDIEEIKKCRDKILKDFKNIDILINGAGGNIKSSSTSKEISFFDIPADAFKRVIDLNLMGVIYTSQIFGKILSLNKNGGSIINISSMNAYRPLTGIPGYSAAKAAVSNFTKWLAVYFAIEYDNNVRVNAIAPGFFLTEQLKYLHFDNEGNPTERAKKVLYHTPMGKYGEPSDLVGVCIWLASDASKFVTGIIVPVDGGFNSYSGV